MKKFEYPISQGSAATYLRFGEKCYMWLVANRLLFLAMQKFGNRLRFNKVKAKIGKGSHFQARSERCHGHLFSGFFSGHLIQNWVADVVHSKNDVCHLFLENAYRVYGFFEFMSLSKYDPITVDSLVNEISISSR